MIPSQQCHVGWVPGLEEQQQCEHLKTVVAPIYKVTHEYVAGGGYFATGFKQPQ